MEPPHPGEEVKYQNVNKGKVCCIHAKKHTEVVISEHIADILLGLLVFN